MLKLFPKDCKYSTFTFNQHIFFKLYNRIFSYSTLEGHTDAITSASFSPDSNLIATTCNNGDFRIWREDSCIYIQDDAHDLGIQNCDFSQNTDPIPNQVLNDSQNYLLATCGNDSFVKLWWISIPKVRFNFFYTVSNFFFTLEFNLFITQVCDEKVVLTKLCEPYIDFGC